MWCVLTHKGLYLGSLTDFLRKDVPETCFAGPASSSMSCSAKPAATCSPSSKPQLTPTQQLLKSLAGLDPSSYKFSREDFYLLMELRAEHSWLSETMNARQWVKNHDIFNAHREKNCAPMQPFFPVLLSSFKLKLQSTENIIRDRWKTKNFTCKYLQLNLLSLHLSYPQIHL
jgi:hypothetical protein